MTRISIPNSVLMNCIRKGGMAAFTSEARDEEALAISPTLDCIRIKPDSGKLEFESSVPKVSCHFTCPTGDVIEVEGKKGFCVKADWLLKSCESIPADYRVVLETAEEEKAKEEGEEGTVAPAGVLLVKALCVEGKQKHSWKGRFYASRNFPSVAYPEGAMIVESQAPVIRGIVDSISFSVNSSDYLDLLNNVGIVREGGKVFFAATDGKRWACKMPVNGEVKAGEGEGTTLANADILKKALDAFGDEDTVRLDDSQDGLNIFARSSVMQVRIALPPANVRPKWPNAVKINSFPMQFSIVVTRDSLMSAILLSMTQNPEMGRYNICEGKGEIDMSAINEGSSIESASVVDMAGTDGVPKSLKNGFVMLNNAFLHDFVRKLSCKTVKISFTVDERRVRLEDPEDPSYAYVLQRMQAEAAQ